jgi:hypothetical protein
VSLPHVIAIEAIISSPCIVAIKAIAQHLDEQLLEGKLMGGDVDKDAAEKV